MYVFYVDRTKQNKILQIMEGNGSVFLATNISTGVNNSYEFSPRSKSFLKILEVGITLYSLIFVLSVIGNVSVILTLLRDKKMRTITNVFLLNLAFSDLLLSVLCMPFTLVAIFMKNFIFGEVMCILIRYFQAVSVGVSCYTLVVISLERYYAICQPFRSRRWQTISHARKMLVAIWLIVMAIMSPIGAFQRTIPIPRKGVKACREIWPDVLMTYSVDKVYSGFLVGILLLLPLLLMSWYYGQIGKELWLNIPASPVGNGAVDGSVLEYNTSISNDCPTTPLNAKCSVDSCGRVDGSGRASHVVVRSVNRKKDVAKRKRVIRMLFVIVFQYFICWSPLYILNTWQVMDFLTLYKHTNETIWSLVLLLAYTSSFIHPVTYCFMNDNFRAGFKALCHCRRS